MKFINSRFRFGALRLTLGAKDATADRLRLSVRLLAGLWAGYALARVLLLPADGAVVNGFIHDSGYISIVAERVRDGAGFTNPAHWLLFLHPAQLPMPFHNANPGYPALIALFSAVLGVDVVYAGLLVSALSSALLAWAVFALVQRFSGDDRFALCCSLAVILFPPLWRVSFVLAPDALSTALALSVLAVATRVRDLWGWATAGGLFGLAWLGRSTSLLILPGLLWWVWRTRTRREAATASLIFALTALLIAAPWLVHTQQTWGSALRSDAGYYLLQDYFARPFAGDVTKFWRSLTPPPSLLQILSSDAKGFLLHTISGAPRLMVNLAAGLAEGSHWAALLLFALLVLATVYSRRHWRNPEFQAGFLIVAATTFSLLLRARTLEIRYFSVATVLLVLWMLLPLRGYFSIQSTTPRRRLRLPLAVGLVLYALVFLTTQDRHSFHELTQISPEVSAYRTLAQEVAHAFPDERAVITNQPYFYTYYTKRPALSPPHVGKPELLRFMEQYSVQLLLLPTGGLDYYYPGFPASLAPEIQTVRQIGSYTLLERTTPP